MGIHVLTHTQTIPASLEECWAFFSDPRNLCKIMPPELDFRVRSDLPPKVHCGMMIEYQVRPLFGIPVTWLTEITHVEELRHFVDEQRVGPYALWHHEHWFRAIDAGRTEVRDRVHYIIPLGLLGEMVRPLLVEPQLEKIFRFRREAVDRIFGEEAATPR